jgi:hypothetical protein
MALLTWLFPTRTKPPRYGIAALKAFGVDTGHTASSKHKADAAEVELAFNGMKGSYTYTWSEGIFRLFIDLPCAAGMLLIAARTELTSALKEPRPFFAFCE